MLLPELKHMRIGQGPLIVWGWFDRRRTIENWEIGDLMRLHYFPAIDAPHMRRRHFRITVEEMPPEEMR